MLAGLRVLRTMSTGMLARILGGLVGTLFGTCGPFYVISRAWP